MKKNALKIIFSFLTIFVLFISSSPNVTQASEVDNNNIVQNDSIFVSQVLEFSSSPPLQYFYDDGMYKGYISRIYLSYSNGIYYTVYAGQVYKNAPIPTRLTPTLE